MSGFPEIGAENFRGNLWTALHIHNERSSGEVAKELPGKFWGNSKEVRDPPEAGGA